MDERKATILRAIVEHYIDTAQPIGSATIAVKAGLEVSSATIRNEMAQLETEGYLEQPHTSAGRIPTQKGYRYFVDQLGAPGRLGPVETRQVRAFFDKAQGAIETRLGRTSQLLSQLTAYAGVVVGPDHDPALVRSVQLVRLEADLLLVVVVLSTGTVERHALPVDPDLDEATVARASQILAEGLVGKGAHRLSCPPPSGDPEVDRLVAAAVEAVEETDEERSVFVGGAANIAGHFEAVETVREVLVILEQQLIVVSMLRDLLDRGLSVAIGSETGLPLSECSVVVAPYTVNGEQVGSIGVVGPTRMDYPRAMAAVQAVSSRLSRSLAGSDG